MKITESQLRRIIREEISLLHEEGGVDTGKEIKGGVAAQKASSKIESNPAIKAALDAIKIPNDLAAFLQDITAAATAKGMDKEEMKTAVKKFGQAVLSANPEKK